MLHSTLLAKPSTRPGGGSARSTLLLLLLAGAGWAAVPSDAAEPSPASPGVAVLLVDTDRVMGTIDDKIYGQFLEHINHSVVDGLFAEQIRGRGFEGEDFPTYWESSAVKGGVNVVEGRFPNGEKSLRLEVGGGTASVRQRRISVREGHTYDGSAWLRPERGSVRVRLVLRGSRGEPLAAVPLATSGRDWQEIGFSFSSSSTDAQATVEVVADGDGAVLLDFLSMMPADARRNGMLRPDLVQALRALRPPFIRWPGGSFASTYRWRDGIGPLVSRKYHPNEIWGGYSDYYSFGTDEFMGLCRRLQAEPLVVLPATTTDPEAVEYALDWVHYLDDPPTTEWGRQRAANGHPDPFGVRYFQIDNEPMNHGLTAEQYADIVNVYGRRLRRVAPGARIVACGQKRSNDMAWSQKVVDLAGGSFDILGVHNYEYEPESFETGLRRIRDYLVKLRDYVRASGHPEIRLAVLEWNLSRTYDWRAGLHAAGSLMTYESLSPELEMSSPALLMRNTTDDPTWTAFIYHDHVSWFPGAAYVVEKLFREHYAERYLASANGTFRDTLNRKAFFDDISQMKPEDWTPGTVDAIATSSADGRRIVVKAVNYDEGRHPLLVRLQGSAVPRKARVTVHSVSAGLTDAASMAEPDRIHPTEHTLAYGRDLTIDLEPYSVAVVEIRAE
jgi:alpha-N-arabinofuranosidase